MELKDLIKESYYYDKTGMLLFGDCLDWMEKFSSKSIDMILTDLPYGTTKCKWDIIIPFDKMWEKINKISKDKTACLLFGVEPFSSLLRISNIDKYKYDWYWNKHHGANFAQANKRPIKIIEIISVFCNMQSNYFPQKYNNPNGIEKRSHYKPSKQKEVFVDQVATTKEYSLPGVNYESDKLLPKCLIDFNREHKPIHPTQKPTSLLEYLIKTYTKEGDIILDFSAGSCSTAIAAKNTNRRWICIEKEERYCEISKKRIENWQKEQIKD